MKVIAENRTSVKEHFVPLKEVLLPSDKEATIRIGDNVGRPFKGFGGALTEASAYVISQMDEKQKNEVLQKYFSKSGLNYVLGRVAIGSSDFSLGSYDYLQRDDRTLQSFSLSHEEPYLFPLLEAIKRIQNKPLTLLASPWSPLAWMKDNKDVCHGGHLQKEFYPLWAEYNCRFIEEMAKRGFPIRWISLQNEPAAVQVWESCIYSAKDEADYALILREKLDEHSLNSVGIYIWDHNRDLIAERADETLRDPKVNAAVEGVAFHWYVSEDFSQVRLTHERHPDKSLLFSEGCIETVNQSEVKMGAFANGERYARNIIGDLSSFAEGWIDWNIVLDEKGGPNHVGNYCEAPVQYDCKTHALYFNHSFYCIEQFSHFIQPGAYRKEMKIDSPALHGVAFLNPEGNLALVLWNEGPSQESTLDYRGEKVLLHLATHSITSFLFEKA
jgi:glucosylceramidase